MISNYYKSTLIRWTFSHKKYNNTNPAKRVYFMHFPHKSLQNSNEKVVCMISH